MLGAILCAVVGLALLVLGGFGISSLAQAPADRIPLIYGSIMTGLVLVASGTLQLVFRSYRRRQLGALGSDGSYGPSVDGSVSHGGDCGHGDGGGGDGGGCGGDGGGGH